MLTAKDMLDTQGTKVKNIYCKDGRWTATVYRGGQKYAVVFDEDGNFICNPA